jgi:hypothetical protein
MITRSLLGRALIIGVAFLGVYAFFFFTFATLVVRAAVSDWQKGINIVPTSPTDLGSDGFKQSLQNFKADGGTSVALVVPYYQSTIHSTDIAPGWNTPTDASLIAALDYAHSIGFHTSIKIFDEPYTGDWRAYINPTDRTTWFNKYGDNLVHLATIAQAHNVELMILGTEMVSVASSKINPDNTTKWQSMISRVRGVFKGSLTYGANSNSTGEDTFVNEKKFVGFWSSLDYVGISAYYQLHGDTVATLKDSWDYWNKADLQPFQRGVGKPILITEVGYRSIDAAHDDPWNSARSANYNASEQSNDYEALMGYFNDYSYIAGVYWWDWKSNPNAGGVGDTDYTVQHKPAESVLKKWFNAPAPPAPSAAVSFTSSGSSNPAAPNAGSATTLSVSLHNVGPALSNTIVDVEVYNASNVRVFQQFLSGVAFAQDQTRSFSAQWTPSSTGTYRMTVGVFTSDWSKNYHWNNSAVSISVQSSQSPPAPTGTYTTNVWWPANGASVTGVQPFKAMLEGLDVSQYQMYWQVDGGPLTIMQNSTVDYPHKEVNVDLSSWKWRGTGPYTVTFVSKNSGGTVISTKSVSVWAQ